MSRIVVEVRSEQRVGEDHTVHCEDCISDRCVVVSSTRCLDGLFENVQDKGCVSAHGKVQGPRISTE